MGVSSSLRRNSSTESRDESTKGWSGIVGSTASSLSCMWIGNNGSCRLGNTLRCVMPVKSRRKSDVMTALKSHEDEN